MFKIKVNNIEVEVEEGEVEEGGGWSPPTIF